MSTTRRPGRARALLAIAVGLSLAVPSLTAAPSSATPAPEVADPVAAYREARQRLVEADAVARSAEHDRDRAADDARRAHGALDRADARLDHQRARYAALSAEYYVRQGADDRQVNDSMHLALSGRRERLDEAKAAQKEARKAAEQADKVLAKAERSAEQAVEQRDRARALADETGAEADAAIAGTGARDLSAIAYLAYMDAAGAVAERHPDCRLSAAVLAGIGRISSGHGRNEGAVVDHLGVVTPALRGLRGGVGADTDGGELDGQAAGDVAMGPMQLRPTTWSGSAKDGDGDGAADPDDLFDAAATTAEALCAPGASLDRFTPLQRAVERLVGEGQQATVALGTARRYARTSELDMGRVPSDPRALVGDGSPQFDTSDTDLAPGDVLGMIDWAMTRLGTPYSQCLGIEARPQDPECPPGTNRFGAGFFDCSGFVSSAFRRIGIAVPVSTYAMEADPTFMSTKVADRIDLSVMEPGDVFLMDGHTGIYVGGGMIIHAVGVGLTYERVPGWVANGTFAVLRPLDLLGT